MGDVGPSETNSRENQEREEPRRENQEREEPRRFKAGDRVRVNDSWKEVNRFLQEDNRVGTVVDIHSVGDYWIHMDKPVIREGAQTRRPSIIPDGHAYYAMNTEIELLESVSEFQKPFDIKEWRKNLKPGDKVRVVENPQAGSAKGFVKGMHKWKGCVVTLETGPDEDGWWRIEEDGWYWNPHWFEPVDRPVNKSGLSKPRKAKEPKKQPPDPRLKTLTQTASELIQIVEATFKDSKQYPVFGINLEKQEAEEKTQRLDLSESLYSLGVILYHLYTGQSEHDNISYLLDGYPKPEDMPEELWRALNKLLKKEYENVNEFRKDLKKCKDGG